MRLDISDAEISNRREAMNGRGENAWKPNRTRVVSRALQAYAAMTTSAANGAVRDLSQIIVKTRG